MREAHQSWISGRGGETQTFENKYWTGKKKGEKVKSKRISYGTKRKSDFGKT